MKIEKVSAKRRMGMGGLAVVFVGAAAMAGCGGGGSGSFVDQNGTQVVGRGEPSTSLRSAVAHIVTDPAPELREVGDDLNVLRVLAPLYATSALPAGSGQDYDPQLGLYINSPPALEGNILGVYTDAAFTQKAANLSSKSVPGPQGYVSSTDTNVEITVGPLAGAKTFTNLKQRVDRTYQYLFQAANNSDAARRTNVRTTAESDKADRVTYVGEVLERSGGRATLHSTSRVIRRSDGSGERRGTYTFNGDVITVSITYSRRGLGGGTLTGKADGLPASIVISDRITSVTYADEKTLDTFDRSNPVFRPFGR